MAVLSAGAVAQQRYRVSMSGNPSETENASKKKKITSYTNVCYIMCVLGGLSAPFFPKSHKNKGLHPNAHLQPAPVSVVVKQI